MNQYYFRLILFNERENRMEKFNRVNSLKYICAELVKAERATGFHIVEFHAKKLTPNAYKLRPEK